MKPRSPAHRSPSSAVAALVLAGVGMFVVGCPSAPNRPARPPRPPAASAATAPDAGMVASEPRPEKGETESSIDEPEGFGERRRRDPSDLCEPVRENLKRAGRAILEGAGRGAVGAGGAWDRSTPPKYMNLVDARFLLTANEKATLQRNGFVVPARLETRGYAHALHDIYQSQLPIYVSADAILHSVFKSNDALLERIEESELAERLGKALGALHETLAQMNAVYPPEVARDLDVYLTVARSLLDETDAAAVLGTDAESRALLGNARHATGGLAQVNLFGRPRIIDFSQYTPRGHYVHSPTLERYFQASIWLSRLELNLVSRASRSSQPGFAPNPEETPREAVVALALADLVERAGQLDALDRFETVWTHFAGKREDVSIRQLLALRKHAGITTLAVPASAEALKIAIGSGFARTTRIHYMPQRSTPLPVIATMLGPRIVADSQAETELVHSHVDGRLQPSFADIAFMLGHDRAKVWLAPELARFPELGAKLEAGKRVLESSETTSMYGAWLGAIRAIADTPSGAVPSYARTPAYADLRINSTVAAYGQLRHNHVLLAGQSYDEGGCEVPDGYVEPALAVYEKLRVYAARGKEAMKAIQVDKDLAAYFDRLDATLAVLVAITKDELAGRELSEEAKRWLSMVVEIVPPSSDSPGSFDGWYFDLFPRIDDAFADHAFVGDWFTSSNASAVVYAGATNPRLGLFVVDKGGAPRLMVGPVARAFEHVGRLDTRLRDADADKLPNKREPWAASYVAPAPPAPPLTLVGLWDDEPQVRTFVLRSTRALGRVSVDVLGHHRTPLGSAGADVGTAWTKIRVKQSADDHSEAVRIRIGDFRWEIGSGFGAPAGAIGGMPEPDWEKVQAVRERFGK